MNPIISPKSFFDAAENIDSYQGLTCWILYSGMHRTLAGYIRENWSAIHEMSSYDCLICVIDRPCSADDSYWEKAEIQTEFDSLLSSKPYNRNDHYKIVRHLGIRYSDMPAFVFFPSVRSKKIIVARFRDCESYDSLTDTFSEIMDCVREVIRESRFRTGAVNGRRAAIQEREDCHLRLEPAIRNRNITNFLRKTVTPRSVMEAVKLAGSLSGGG